MTFLRNRVKRETQEVVRDRGKPRQIVITLYPGGLMGLRLKGTRKEFQIGIRDCYYRAVDLAARRLIAERKEKRRLAKENRLAS